MTRKIMTCRDWGESENGTNFHNPLYTLYFVIYLKSSKVGEGFYIIVVKQRQVEIQRGSSALKDLVRYNTMERSFQVKMKRYFETLLIETR